MMEAQAAALARAEETARGAARALQDERAAHAAELAAADNAVRDRDRERQQHEAALAAVNSTVTALRRQLARAETALDRERAQQHETVALLRGLIASRPESPEPKAARRQPASR